MLKDRKQHKRNMVPNFHLNIVTLFIVKSCLSTTATTVATKRYVFNFTINDDNQDSINVSCWGTVDYVTPLSDLCFIGAHGNTSLSLK